MGRLSKGGWNSVNCTSDDLIFTIVHLTPYIAAHCTFAGVHGYRCAVELAYCRKWGICFTQPVRVYELQHFLSQPYR